MTIQSPPDYGNVDSAYELYLAMDAKDHPDQHDSAGHKSDRDGKGFLEKIGYDKLKKILSRIRYHKKAPELTQKDVCKQFKKTLSHENVSVHFVGAWCVKSSEIYSNC